MTLSRRAVLGSALGSAFGLPGLAHAAPAWPGALIMGTGRAGGYYSAYGAAWGRLARQATGVEIAFRASGGAAADILLIEQNEAQLGMTTLIVANEARRGTGAWTAGVKFRSFRGLFPMFDSMVQIVAPAGTGVSTLSGLAGRRVGVGPDGGSGAASMAPMLHSLGIKPALLAQGGYEQQVAGMLAGRLDACAFLGAPPIPAITRVAMGRPLSLIGFSAAEAQHVAQTQPGMSPTVLPAGSFPGQKVAVGSVGTGNFAICAASLPVSLVRAITLAALRNRDQLAGIVPGMGGSAGAQDMLRGDIGLHPGAAAALRSFGLDVPARYVWG
ncbi:MAG: TAXI family TRAP transporter solute-binding subunit [Acidocella sp.]|nr:TAXI family TRAP transporter solute-binding subunit [Acidocella sp.]